MASDRYLLDNAVPAAGPRLDALAELFDPSTFRHVTALGIARGWRCWEVGAGGPSVARWLADQVGPAGHVLATDLDVSWAHAAARDNVEVRRHDVAVDPPPGSPPGSPPGPAFDLVHARLVLVHVAERERALRSMVAAVRPGGWLLVEDADPALQPLACLEADRPEHVLANHLRTTFRALLAERGADLAFGRKLPRLLRAAGLRDVAADAQFPVVHPACARLERKTIEHVRDRLLASGRATRAEIDEHLANLDAGTVDIVTSPMISAWGRRPESAPDGLIRRTEVIRDG
ncbi:MAG TPA: methyltransferase [Kofleriaceae bacterium]|nr:methyltransferase [Kofleriaceae bacterium]